MPLSPLAYETMAGGEFTSQTFQPSSLGYPAVVVSISKIDARDTWYRAGWLEFSGFYGAIAPLRTLLSTTPLGINEPRLITLPPFLGASTLLFSFTPVYWLGEYTIQIEGLTP